MFPLAHGLLAAGGINPASIFKDGDAGEWWDFTDSSTLYQDDAATIQADTEGDAIRACIGKVNGVSLDSNGASQNGSFENGLLFGSNDSQTVLRFDGADIFSGFEVDGPSILAFAKRGPTIGGTYAFLFQTSGNGILLRFYADSHVSITMRGAVMPLQPANGDLSFNCFGAGTAGKSQSTDVYVNGLFSENVGTSGTTDIDTSDDGTLYIEPDYEIAGVLIINRKINETEMNIFNDYYLGKSLS